MQQVQIFKNEVLRYPRLDTVLMIEKAVRDARGDLTVTRLWKALPRKVMWQTFLTVLDYLEYSGKILVEKDRHVIWIWAPAKIRKLRTKGLVLR